MASRGRDMWQLLWKKGNLIVCRSGGEIFFEYSEMQIVNEYCS